MSLVILIGTSMHTFNFSKFLHTFLIYSEIDFLCPWYFRFRAYCFGSFNVMCLHTLKLILK